MPRLSNPSPACAPVAVALLLLGATAAVAQESTLPSDGPYTSITGYRGMEWGASKAEAIESSGEPTERRRLENGLQILAYRGELVGRPAVTLLGFLDERGLVKAQKVSDLADDERCIEQVREIHREINLRYPLIRPAEEAKNNSPESICQAAPAGEAYWHRQWTDDSTGSIITVSVRSGSGQVELTYESQAFRDWVDPEGEAEPPEIEDEGAPTEVLEAQP